MAQLKLYGIMAALFMLMSCKDSPEVVRAEPKETVQNEIAYSKDVYKPGAEVFGSKSYTKIIVGDLASPIILSSPHDGTLAPSAIPTRTHSDAVTVRDTYATNLTMSIADSLKKLTGLRPHIIVNLLSRAKMDPNRSLEEAYLTHADATKAWNDYQDFIKIARTIVNDNVGKGLYLDMHGHGHTKSRIEVGYILSKADLNKTDSEINGLAFKSSIYAIAKSSTLPFYQLVRGDNAFGTLLANNSCPAVPSKQDPKPNSDDYFNGGYCTLTYGSISGGTISAIQLETPGANRTETAKRNKAGGGIARAVTQYLKVHYNMDLAK